MNSPNLKIVEYEFRTPYSIREVSPSGVLEMAMAFGSAKAILTSEEVNYSRRRTQKTPRCLRV